MINYKFDKESKSAINTAGTDEIGSNLILVIPIVEVSFFIYKGTYVA